MEGKKEKNKKARDNGKSQLVKRGRVSLMISIKSPITWIKRPRGGLVAVN